MEVTINPLDNLNDLKQQIRKFSFSIGFHKIGFAKHKVLDSEFQNYLFWLESGFHASMHYLEKNLEKRRDLQNILPDVKSVVVFAHSYNTNFSYSSDIFKISRYAWGNDYHTVIYDKIIKVVNFIEAIIPEFKYKIYVDTGPILEKFWAIESGLGWQGKNSLVLNKELGSYFFIGILLTNIPFESDPKENDHCGKCTRCIDACPTKAIVLPKVVDSRRCISFWTIEKKINEEIPDDIDLNGWIFGCDICQEVCPWNKKAKFTNESQFFPFRFGTNFTLELLNSLTKERFLEITRNSPIRRAKFEGLLKNYQHILRKI